MIFLRLQRIKKETKIIKSIKNKRNETYIEQSGGKCPIFKLFKSLNIVFVLHFFSESLKFLSTETSFIMKQPTTKKKKLSISFIEISCERQYDNNNMK